MRDDGFCVIIGDMANVLTRPGWYIAEKFVTPEKVFRNRRAFLRELGFAGGAALLGQALQGAEGTNAPAKKYPFARTKQYEIPGLQLSPPCAIRPLL